MAKLGKLTAAGIKNARVGRHGDGGGLALQVQGPDKKSWLFRFTSPVTRKEREMGLGSLDAVSISRARALAAEYRAVVAAGTDPLEARAAPRPALTFRAVAEGYIAAHTPGWRSAKHASQWAATLETYVYPIIGTKVVTEVTTEDVLRVLRPIWSTRTETATRVRGRIEAVLDAAKAEGHRSGENPAAWRGHLALLLPAKAKVAPVEHHAALPWQEAPAFMAALARRGDTAVSAGRRDIGARALAFTILTAARSGEVRGATWGEVDLDAKVWTVPGQRMKAGREHRVPLTDPTLAILAALRPADVDAGALVFPGARKGSPLSDMTLTAVLRRMGKGDLTAHGFRSTFRDWAAETGQSSDLAEAALAHTLGSAVQRAYQRGDRLELRRALMSAWAEYLAGPG